MSTPSLITVQTPALPGLVDLQTVRDELQIDAGDRSNDQWFDRAIQQASRQVNTYCNRVFGVQQVQEQIWPGTDAVTTDGTLLLSLRPDLKVISVASMDSVPTIYVQGIDLALDARGNALVMLDETQQPIPWFSYGAVVVYQTGFSPIPADIVEATLRIITGRYRSRGRDPALKGDNATGMGGNQYWAGGMPGGMPSEAVSILNSYRLLSVA